MSLNCKVGLKNVKWLDALNRLMLYFMGRIGSLNLKGCKSLG